MKRWFAACLGALCFAAAPAGAGQFVIQPGPEGEDVSPYSFVPWLNRGQYTTNYAFVGSDENGITHEFETYLRFPLPNVAASRVIEAWVRLDYAFTFTAFGGSTEEPGEIRCHQVLEPWSENAVTWENRPAIAAAFDEDTPITEPGYVYCDVTELVKDWLSGAAPNHGIALTNETPHVIGMYSFEETSVAADAKATLLIETKPPPGAGCGMLGIEAWAVLAALEPLRRLRSRRRSSRAT